MVKNDKGNYRGYYKMRPDSNTRLSHLNAAWFQGMTCLDVGCNDGQFCLALAEHFAPKFMLGIDPDFVLIDCAQSRLKRLQYGKQAEPVESRSSETASTTQAVQRNSVVAFGGFLPRSVAVKTVAKTSTAQQSIGGSSMTPSVVHAPVSVNGAAPVRSPSELFPFNVKFKAKDIFEVSTTINSTVEGKYDAVTCFSVTKWIHLNGGDSKLIELLCKLYCLVRKGGRVIVEYQPWKSYVNNRTASETIKKVFPSIQIRPEHFEWLLTEIVGFDIEHRLGTPLAESKGFDRPILVLRRPLVVSAARVWDNHTGFETVCKYALARMPSITVPADKSAASAVAVETHSTHSAQADVAQSSDSQKSKKRKTKGGDGDERFKPAKK